MYGAMLVVVPSWLPQPMCGVVVTEHVVQHCPVPSLFTTKWAVQEVVLGV